MFLSKISTKYFRTAIQYSAKKLTLIEEVCINFKQLISLGMETKLMKSFNRLLNGQLDYHVWSEKTSTKYSGNVTVIMLLGALYLVFGDENIKTDKIDVSMKFIGKCHKVS